GAVASSPGIWRPRRSSSPIVRSRPEAILWPAIGLLAIAAALAWLGADAGSALRHLYLIPALLAALRGGARSGRLIGLVSGLLQAPLALPAVERLGLTSRTVDGLISLGLPLAFGWLVGRLVDRSRERAARLDAVLDVQRTLCRGSPLEAGLLPGAGRVRAAVGADRVGLVLRWGTGEPIVAGVPNAPAFDDASAAGFTLRSGRTLVVSDVLTDARIGADRTPGARPVRGATLAIDAGQGPL